MPKNIDTAVRPENAVLIGVINQEQDVQQVKEYLDELAFLVKTAGANPVKQFTQKVNVPNARTLIGEGKLEEVDYFVKDNDIDLVVFDDDLTPTQHRNIEKVLKCKLLDRTNLILDIFA